MITFDTNTLPDMTHTGRIPFFAGIIFFALTSACRQDHFITDADYRSKVETQFEMQKELARNRSRQLFGVFDQQLTTREEEALKFLYAYSPLSDLADYTGEFFLQNVRSSFAARDTFSWGRTVPENLFRHFVLPVRVNNENLDSSRWVFFTELKDRIRNLPMKEAVLEVNHWCHEKVTYRGSDSRTSSPLATVRTAWGRCGEESTFTVAALRSVCIPARQCYTPRWAHSDDNHAWVEVWVDGRWHFIGACEPEPEPDLAWFTGPAKRAMLVNTTVFGDYQGPEDVLVKDPLFTRINILENYAQVKRIFARVTDAAGKGIDSATVEFQLYNYAEFYPLFKTVTDNSGFCSFTTGYGDLVVWAAKEGKYGFRKIDVRAMDTITILLDRKPGDSYALELDLVPPSENALAVSVSEEAKKKNGERLAFEDGLRGSYETTFIDSLKSARFARLAKLDPDTLWSLFRKSCGNWRTLTAFITLVPENRKNLIFPLLENISEKDLRDIDTAVLLENISLTSRSLLLSVSNDDFNRYVLSPRVSNENLKPFRKIFLDSFDGEYIAGAKKDPERVAEWIRKEIRINTTANYSRAPLTPAGVYDLRVADPHSADILFVAICRSFGIPARLDPATRIPQFMSQNKWHDVILDEKSTEPVKKGLVVLENAPGNGKKPEYTTHYTLEEYKAGFFRTLDYEGSPMVQSFPCTLEIPAGPCMMVTGNRLTNGTVLCGIRVFDVRADSTVRQSVGLRKNRLPLPEYGKINTESLGRKITSGMVIAWIDPDKEPTKHLLADLRQKKGEFEKWKGTFIIVLPSEVQKNNLMKTESSSLPAGIRYENQPGFPLGYTDLKTTRGIPASLPVVIYVNNDGIIHYLSEGYRIGIGDELLELLTGG